MLRKKSIKNISRVIIIGIFILLVFRSIFFNSIYQIAHSPDLGYHIAVSDVYRQHPFVLFFWSIKDVLLPCINGSQPDGFFLTTPFLYQSIIGKILYVFELFGFKNPVQLTSLVQAIFGLLTIYFIYLTAKLLTKDRFIHYLSLVLASSIPMFTFIINYLTYDNLTNLLATITIYYFCRFIKFNQIKDIFLIYIFLILGLITKITMMPLFFIISFLILFHIKSKFFEWIKEARNFILIKSNIPYTLVFVMVLLITLLFYGKNLYLYGKLIPGSVTLITRSCDVDTTNLTLINDKLVKEEIRQNIKSTNNLIKNTANIKPLNLISYFVKWQSGMRDGIFNIISHRSLVKSSLINRIYLLFIIIFLLAIIWQIMKKNKSIFYLFFIFSAYTAFYFFYMYLSYQKTLITDSGIQGRYLFPVLAAFIVPASYSILNVWKNKNFRIILFILIAVFFVFFDFFWFLRHYQVWYALPPLDLVK